MAFCEMPVVKDSYNLLSPAEYDYLNSDILLKDKIMALADMLQLKDEDISYRKKIVLDIVRFLHPFYPKCSVFIFGSSMNGFGFRGCDLDLLFLPFPDYCNFNFKEKTQFFPQPRAVLSGNWPKEQLLLMDEVGHLKFVQRVMHTKRYYFEKVFFIPAKCPILNIKFTQHAVTSDFSASNRLVVYNTNLLWLLGTLDYRVRPLLMFLRYWAKSLGFISKSLLSSYAFSLMVIFFLQNTQPPILPSVKYLSEIAGYTRIIDGWETAICMDQKCWQTENFTPVDELLLNFFEFYWNFDFIHMIVSVHQGRPLAFSEVEKSEDERIKHFQVTSFSIQDPFCLSRNVSRNQKMKISFKLALQIAKQLVIKPNFSIEAFLSNSFYQEQMNEVFAITKSVIPDSISFPVHLNYNLSCKLGVTISQIVPWYMKVCEVVLDVLQYGLLADCEVVDKVICNKTIWKQPTKKRAYSAEDLELLISIQCRLHLCSLQNRHSVDDSDLEPETDFDLPEALRKHFKVSKWLIEKTSHLSPVLWFMCQCYKYSCSQISDVIVTFSSITDESIFNQKKIRLKSFVQKRVGDILQTM